MQVLEDDHGGTAADAIQRRAHDGFEAVVGLGHRVEAEGVERELERTAERPGLGLAGEHADLRWQRRDQLAQQTGLADAGFAHDQRDGGIVRRGSHQPGEAGQRGGTSHHHRAETGAAGEHAVEHTDQGLVRFPRFSQRRRCAAFSKVTFRC